MLGLFVRLVRRPLRLLDSLASNSYAIHILHFPVIVWTQTALLDAESSALGKCLLVVLVGILTSWTLGALLRRVPAIRSVV